MKKQAGVLSLIILFVVSGFLFARAIPDVPADEWVYIQIADQEGTDNGFWTVGGEDEEARKGSILKLRKYGVNPRSQKFRLVSAGRDLYYLESKQGGYLEIVNHDDNLGSEIRLWKKDQQNRAQKFKVEHLRNGKYRIIAKNDRVVCPADNAPDHKKFVRALDKPRDARSRWIIIPVGSQNKYDPDYREPQKKPGTKPGKNKDYGSGPQRLM